jgi:hypothetical protein
MQRISDGSLQSFHAVTVRWLAMDSYQSHRLLFEPDLLARAQGDANKACLLSAGYVIKENFSCVENLI